MTISSKCLIKHRRDRGWTQEKLAAIAGISERTIQRAEKDGTCSLETKMALITALEVSPVELADHLESEPLDQVTNKTSVGGIVGLFILGLTAPVLVLLTGQYGAWEAVSFFIVIGFTVVLSLVNYGARATYVVFDNSSWLVRHPIYVAGLNVLVFQAKSIIGYAYIVGVVAAMVTALTLAVHAPQKLEMPFEFFMLVMRPLFYAVLFAELWFRPYKRKMESMLMEQTNAERQKNKS